MKITLAAVEAFWLIVATVQPDQKPFSIRSVAKSALAGLLVVSWLFVVTLAASNSLHQRFDHGAASHDHFCAVTLLQHGKMMAADASPLLLILASLFLFCLPLAQPARFVFPDLRLGFGRAPPHFFGLR